MQKERDIIVHCADRSVIDGKFDPKIFKKIYESETIYILDHLLSYANQRPIDNWSKSNIDWELSKELDFGIEINDRFNTDNLENVHLVDDLIVEIMCFQHQMRLKNDLIGFFIDHDWLLGNLRNDFATFLEPRHSREQAAEFFKFLHSFMKIKKL